MSKLEAAEQQAAEPMDADRARFIIAHLCNTFPELAHCHPARQQQVAEQDLAELIDALKKFRGLPPYNSISNPCQGDGYFYAGIEAKYTPEQIAAANVALDTSAKPALAEQAGEPVVGWVLLREDADGFEPIMFYGGKEKPEGEFKDRFTLRPIRFADVTQQPLTAAQVLALYQKWGTGRLEGFTEAIREYEAALGIILKNSLQPT